MGSIRLCKAPNCDKPRDVKQRSTLCVMHRVRWGRYKSYDLPQKPELPFGIVLICKHHGELKEEQCYFNEKYGYPQCIICKKTAMEKFKEKNPKRDTNKLRSHFVIRRHNIKFSKEEYYKLLKQQGNVCAICKGLEKSRISNKKINENRPLAIDHCHDSKMIRGLLCSFCNKGLGHFNDSIDLLKSAIKYLKKHEK